MSYGAVALLLAVGGVLGTAFGIMFRAVIKAKDDHIAAVTIINGDLMENNANAIGVTSTTLRKVPDRRAPR